jgi:putative phage-type endonuclease
MKTIKGNILQIHSLIQGSPEWHAYRANHFNASDAPAMMGASPYKTRSQLLAEYATGSAQEVDAATQRRFDDGHRFEALCRPLGEKIIGDDLYPVVGSDGNLSASFDGLTMDESIAYEHKTLNDELRAVMVDGCAGADLPAMYRIQMEQQCMVSGAGRVLFMASKWAGDELVEERHCWYERDLELAEQINAGWEQFTKDLAEYVPVEVLPAAVAAPTMGLPALSIQVNGAISLISNLDIFGAKLAAFIKNIDKNPSDDQSFADAEAAIKTLEKAQEALEAAESSALAQTASIDDMRKTVAMYSEMARTNRLLLEKLVKARKEAIRIEIQQAALAKCAEHFAALNQRLGKPYMPRVEADFAGVMKGKKTIASLRDAVDTELARFKIEANAIADRIQINLATLRELAADYAFLFADAAQIVLKATDDCAALVKMRISDHKAAEEKRLAAERERIAAEERTKAETRVRAEQEAVASDQRRVAMLEAHQQRRQDEAQEAAHPAPTTERADIPMHAEKPAPSANVVPINPSTPPTLRLGQIGERLGFTVTADFLMSLGFPPAATDKSAKLYHEADFPRICAALVNHINRVQERLAA